MGIFDKLKKSFIKEKKETKTEETKDIKIYDKGLTKTRDNFVKFSSRSFTQDIFSLLENSYFFVKKRKYSIPSSV